MKKTKAQLEKENSKLLKQLELYKNAGKDKPKENAGNLNKDHALINIKPEITGTTEVPSMPDFVIALNQIYDELYAQKDLCDIALSKLSLIDGLTHEEPVREKEATREGVIGTLILYRIYAYDNRSKMESINSRLTKLVG